MTFKNVHTKPYLYLNNPEEMLATETIENLGLYDLRKYACQKIMRSNDWFLKCGSCLGKDGCRVGLRVQEILENDAKLTGTGMTIRMEKKREEPPKAEEAPPQDETISETKMGAKKPLPLVSKAKVRAKYEAALKTEDPIGYLVKNGYSRNRELAGNAIREWCKTHGVQCEKLAVEKTRNTEWVQKKKDETRKMVTWIFEGHTADEAELELIRMNPEITCHGLSTKIRMWMRNYPDLRERYPDMDKMATRFGLNSIKQTLVKDYRAEKKGACPDVKPTDEEDILTVDEVLATMNEDGMTTEKPEEPQAAETKKAIADAPDTNRTSVQEELTCKKKQLTEQEEMLRQELQAIADKIAALDTVLKMYA